tara:strand:- start:305 stop:559 length:255 start_codon:yes stop_codon:yes gene_type:complete
MYPNSALIILSYFDFRILSAAFFRVVPKRLGGILTISTNVDTENNYSFFLEFQFMSLWVIMPFYHEFEFVCILMAEDLAYRQIL